MGTCLESVDPTSNSALENEKLDSCSYGFFSSSPVCLFLRTGSPRPPSSSEGLFLLPKNFDRIQDILSGQRPAGKVKPVQLISPLNATRLAEIGMEGGVPERAVQMGLSGHELNWTEVQPGPQPQPDSSSDCRELRSPVIKSFSLES